VVIQAVPIRLCEERDLEHFHALGGSDHVRYCREQFARGPQACTILVATDEHDAPVGKVHLDLETRATTGEAVLVAAAVRSDRQGNGIGTALMAAAEEHVCSSGLDSIVLGVEDFNPGARRLYERLGYDEFARDEFKYVGAPIPNPGSWMRKELVC
jgi:ribosomal protein S18 acetylase RimI-like enzyme